MQVRSYGTGCLTWLVLLNVMSSTLIYVLQTACFSCVLRVKVFHYVHTHFKKILFTHGHRDGFHTFTTVITATVIRRGQASVPDLDLNSFKYPEARLLDQMAFLFLIYDHYIQYVILHHLAGLLVKLMIPTWTSERKAFHF